VSTLHPIDGTDPAHREVRTGCPYCGVGCGLVADVAGGRLRSVRGDDLHPVNRGRTCQKPLALPEAAHSDDRAVVPLWRDDRDTRFTESSWSSIVPRLARRMEAIRREHGPDSIAFYLSGQLLTEDYYAVSKLAKGFLGTNNVDSNSRLCMSSAVAGYDATFGSDGPPPSYSDIESADCFLLVGSNAAACHPILWGRIRERQAQGARVIVIDPRRTDTAASADLHLPVRPGGDLVLLTALLAEVDRAGLLDRDYLAAHVEGHEEMLAAASRWTAERAARVCGVDPEAIIAAARLFGAAGAALALWSMGVNQSTAGTRTNRAILNLCLATGNVGRPGAGPLSLTGQPNAMGGREVGGLAQLLPGYRKVASEDDRRAMTELWELPPEAAGISARPGLPATDLFDALEDGRVRAVWICGTNPVVSMPDAERVRAALARAELVVVQDAYNPTETGALAHAVLPAAQWPEKQGVMTNSERRVTLVRKAIDPPGDALPDWEIFARLARAFGFGDHFGWESAAEVYDEFAALTAGRPCDQTGISHARLETEGTIQWPCTWAGHPGTERLYADGAFNTPSGRARVDAAEPDDLPEPPDADYPLVLTTGRIASQWHTMTRTGKSRRLLAAEPEPFLEIHPDDAARAGIEDGEGARVTSRRGSAVLAARFDDSLAPGVVFAPMHWGALHAPPGAGTVNELTHRATDPTSRQPALKATAVRVEPARIAPPRRARVVEPRRLLIVGAGPAGVATAESVVEHARPGSWAITLAGREPGLPYNRVALSDHLAGFKSAAALNLRDRGWYAERGIDLRVGDEVADVDPVERVALTRSGERLRYDAMVIATGSQPLLPPIEGIDRDGVVAFRTRDDVRRILAEGRRARRAIVIGGGLLGLEAARGLKERGLPVSVVHLVDRVMERQLDAPAARLLERALRRLGIEVLLERATTEVLGDERATGLRFAWGDDLEGDLIVVSAGIRPDVGLANAIGLDVERAIVVDDAMRTNVPGVWAVGECAQHRGLVHGLWGPIREQARVAGAAVAGAPGAFHGSIAVTQLKVAGIDLFCAGLHSAEAPEDDEVVTMNTRSGVYRKLVLRDERLVGAILLGDTSLGGRLRELIRTGAPVPDDLVGLEPASCAGDADSDDALVCACNAVSRGQIVAAVEAQGLTHVDQVARATGATTGCGTCRNSVAGILRGATPTTDVVIVRQSELSTAQTPFRRSRV
jgi:ferredoxin-nitrate reductase